MTRRHPPKIFSRKGSSNLWIRFYDAEGTLQRLSAQTDDPVVAQEVLDQRLREVGLSSRTTRNRVTVRTGLRMFEEAGILSSEELVTFRRLAPFVAEALDSHGITTLEKLRAVRVNSFVDWLFQIEFAGETVQTASDGSPIYVGNFRLSDDAIYHAFILTGRMLEFILNKSLSPESQENNS